MVEVIAVLPIFCEVKQKGSHLAAFRNINLHAFNLRLLTKFCESLNLHR